MRPELAHLLRLAIPIAAGQLAAFGVPFVDTVLAGHLGPKVLGAAAIGGSLYSLAFVAVMGVLMSLQPTISTLDGQNRRDLVGAYGRQAMLLGLFCGTLAGVALFALGPPALRLAGVAPVLRTGATSFLHAVSWALPSIGLFCAARGLSEGLSRTVPTMLVQFAGLFLLAPLGAVLMYGLLGVPALGVAGSGIATAITWAAEAALFLAILRSRRRYPGVDWRSGSWMPDLRILGALLRLGVPIASSFLLEVGMFSAAGLIVASLGPTNAAGNQVALSVVTITFTVPLAIATAATVRAGHAAGRGDGAGLRRVVALGFALVAGAEIVSASTLFLLPRHIARLYGSDARTVATAAAVLRWGAFFQVSDGVQCFANGVLRGLQDARVPMGVVLVCYWAVGVPLGAVLCLRGGGGAAGMWIGLLVGLTLAAALLSARLLHLLSRRGGAEFNEAPLRAGAADGTRSPAA